MPTAKRKIAVVTGTRAEYGLLKGLITEINNDPELELQIIATCMHLSHEFGMTYRLIEEDGFKISAKVEMLLSTDTAVGITKSVGLGVIGFADAYERLKPDLVLILGDRFEALAAAQAAMFAKIPVAHIHGGELSEGAVDDSIRHSITKMSCLHFVAAEPYRQRVIQMGEQPDTVFAFGAPGLERIANTKLLDKKTLEQRLDFTFGEKTFLVTYHPATLDLSQNDNELQAIFDALKQFPEAKVIFTKANADEAGRRINGRIDEYVNQHQDRMTSFITMGDLNYISSLQFVDVVIGNSSSAIIEVPVFYKPTINIGTRQDKRLRSDSIIDIKGGSSEVVTAIKQAVSADFVAIIDESKPAYIQEKTSIKIKSKIKEMDLEKITKKTFNDIGVATRLHSKEL